MSGARYWLQTPLYLASGLPLALLCVHLKVGQGQPKPSEVKTLVLFMFLILS